MPGINLKKNILLGGSSRLLIMGLSFLCSWISARFLGVELKGQYSYLVTLGGFIWMVPQLSLSDPQKPRQAEQPAGLDDPFLCAGNLAVGGLGTWFAAVLELYSGLCL